MIFLDPWTNVCFQAESDTRGYWILWYPYNDWWLHPGG